MPNPLEYAERICYSTRETLEFSYEMAKVCKYTDGVFVECGVAAGAQVIAMAAGAPKKLIFAFDSFQGIPLPSNRDDQMPGIKFLSKEDQSKLPNPGEQVLETTGATSVSQDDFMAHLINSGIDINNIKVVPGWFEETVPKFLDVKIALLRLDGDLYNSTYVCLKHLFPKVVQGGFVIIDDWQLPGCRDACIDYFHSIKYSPKYQYISNIAYFEKW